MSFSVGHIAFHVLGRQVVVGQVAFGRDLLQSPDLLDFRFKIWRGQSLGQAEASDREQKRSNRFIYKSGDRAEKRSEDKEHAHLFIHRVRRLEPLGEVMHRPVPFLRAVVPVRA